MTDDATRQVEPPEMESSGATATDAAPAGGGSASPVVTASGGANRARWAIGLGVAGLAIVAVIAAILMLGSRPTPPALTYIPGDAVVVAEFRPDLPGDQLQKLGNLLAHFPGFADQSTLPDKLDESFTQLLGRASGGSVDYTADIKPWLSGPAFVALLPPSNATADNPMSFLRGVASLTTTGTVACESLLEGVAVTHETYRNLDLVIDPRGASACVTDGTQALIGDTASVRKALDTRADGTGVDKDATYQEARTSLEGDQLAALYMRGTGYQDMIEGMMELTPGMSDSMACVPATFPGWLVQGLRAEDDSIVLDTVAEVAPAPTAGATPVPSLLPFAAAHQSEIMPFAPANTIVLFESQGIGVTVQNTLAQLRTCPMYGQALDVLNGTGDPAELVGWIDDVGLIVVNGDGGVTGGLVVVAKDAAAASERVGALKGLISLAAMSGAAGIDSTDTTIAGVTVTTVTISNLDGMAPGQFPPGFLPEDGAIEFSIAAKDRVILLAAGAGDTFMSAALSVQAGAGLVDQAGYKTATSRALSASQMTFYVAIRDIVGIVEPLIPADARARWESEIKPYFAPFQALSMSSSTDGNLTGRSRLILTVSNP
jgi:Protein of unknown function (DUF3352)